MAGGATESGGREKKAKRLNFVVDESSPLPI
jgi:hypothetical protein